MLHVTITDDGPYVPTSDFVRSEILRLCAPATEIEAALAFVANEAAPDMRAYQKLSPRMRRLIDLFGVAGRDVCATSAAFERQPNKV